MRGLLIAAVIVVACAFAQSSDSGSGFTTAPSSGSGSGFTTAPASGSGSGSGSIAPNGVKPVDMPCVSWIPLNSNENTDPTDLFLAAYTWVRQDGNGNCIEMGDIFPCFASNAEVATWGHHDYASDISSDYCRTWINGSVYYANNMYVPKKGPKWQTWEWQLAQRGGTVPANAIRYGDKVMARSTVNAAGECCGKGFTGWVHGLEDGKFGSVHFGIQTNPEITDSFEVAICKAYHPTPSPTTAAPTSPPTLPPNNKPYIRFGHTIPTSHNVDCVITQGSVAYTWTNFAFGQFSPWVEVFSIGYGTVAIFENVNGTRGKLLVQNKYYLTPGPLVIVAKDYWPPSKPWNIEAIAASYVPVAEGSGVRLFNLSPDTASAGMRSGNTTLVRDVKYTIGSAWANIGDNQQTFTVYDQNSKKVLASDTLTPPAAPYVFTNFLIGLQQSAGGKFSTRLVPLIDAPE